MFVGRGDKGYVLIERGAKPSECGILKMASYPEVKKHTEITV